MVSTNTNISIQKSNINIYGFKNVTPYCTDSTKLVHGLYGVDIFYVDPPWGGSGYKDKTSLRLSIGSTPVEKLVIDLFDSEKTVSCPKLVCLKLPTNYDMKYLYTTIKARHNVDIILYTLKKMLLVVVAKN